MLLNQASVRRDDVSLVTCPGVLHACVATLSSELSMFCRVDMTQCTSVI